jgi:hypothetical protein
MKVVMFPYSLIWELGVFVLLGFCLFASIYFLMGKGRQRNGGKINSRILKYSGVPL